MPLTTTTLWPSLTDGKKAKASEVESKFDWLEGDQWPMIGGVLTNDTYDMGSAAYRWNLGYFKQVSADNLVTTGGTLTTDEIRATAKAWGWGIGASGSVTTSYNISSVTLLSTGVYRVAWTTPFATNTYAVVANGVRVTAVIASVENLTVSSADVYLFNDAGAAMSSVFDVLAVGEQ